MGLLFQTFQKVGHYKTAAADEDHILRHSILPCLPIRLRHAPHSSSLQSLKRCKGFQFCSRKGTLHAGLAEIILGIVWQEP